LSFRAAYTYFDMEKKDLDFITQAKTKNAKTGDFETGFLINLIDSNGLGSLSTVEQAGRIITDGVIVVVDCIAGVCSQTEVVLKQAVKARIKPVLYINTMDRALIELHMEEEELYETIKEIIEKVNNVLANNDGAMGDVRVDVNNGSVLFGSTLHGWAFSMKQVAEMYGSKLEMPVDKVMERLWGENFFNHLTLDWEKKKSKDNKRSFCAFALTPLSKVINAIMNFKKEQTEKLLTQVATTQGKLLKDVLTAEEMELEGEPLMKCVMRNWLPAGEAMFQMITIHLPSPVTAQKYKAELLFQGHHDHLPPYAMQAIKNCDPQAPLVMYVSKMFPFNDSEHFYAVGRVFSG
jgi:elongation factor 2